MYGAIALHEILNKNVQTSPMSGRLMVPCMMHVTGQHLLGIRASHALPAMPSVEPAVDSNTTSRLHAVQPHAPMQACKPWVVVQHFGNQYSSFSSTTRHLLQSAYAACPSTHPEYSTCLNLSMTASLHHHPAATAADCTQLRSHQRKICTCCG